MSFPVPAPLRHSNALLRGLLRAGLGAASPRLLHQVQHARSRARYLRTPERGPSCLQLELATGCNYRCLMCAIHSPHLEHRLTSRMMPWESLERVLHEAAALGTEWVWFVGRGEPTLHPRFVDAVALAGSLGLRPVATTNGSHLNPEQAEALCEGGLSHLSVSLNAASPATYAFVNQAPAGAQDRILAMMRHVARRPHPPRLAATMVVVEPNAHEILPFVQQMIEVGAVEIGLSGLRRAYCFPMLAVQDWEAVRHQLAAARGLATEAGVALRVVAFPPEAGSGVTDAPPAPSPRSVGCFVGYRFARLDAEGGIHGCDMGSNALGNAFATSLQEAWRSPAYERFRDVGRQIPHTGVLPSGCTCEECCHRWDMVSIHRELGFQPLHRLRESRYATQLGVAQLVWEVFRLRLRSGGQRVAYLDAPPGEAGAAWAAVSHLSALGVLEGVPAFGGRRRFLPSDTVRGEQMADLLGRLLALLRVPAPRAAQLIADSAPPLPGPGILLEQEAAHWVRTVHSRLAKETGPVRRRAAEVDTPGREARSPAAYSVGHRR